MTEREQPAGLTAAQLFALRSYCEGEREAIDDTPYSADELTLRLLAERDQLRADLERAREERDVYLKSVWREAEALGACRRERDAARAELEALRVETGVDCCDARMAGRQSHSGDCPGERPAPPPAARPDRGGEVEAEIAAAFENAPPPSERLRAAMKRHAPPAASADARELLCGCGDVFGYALGDEVQCATCHYLTKPTSAEGES